MKKVYCDISATTPIDAEVINLIHEINQNIFGNPSSVHKFGQESHVIIEKARIQIADNLNCHQEEIIFTGCGTEANNIAIKGIIEKKSHIISSSYEHPAVLNVLKSLENDGHEITLIKPDKDGKVKPSDVENAIKENTKLITIMYANNELGSINDVTSLTKIANKNKIPIHLDAVQCIGKIPIDLNDLNVDLLSMSAHKFYGPKGVGALYVKKGINLKPIIDGGGQESNLRSGTENVAGIGGMGLAISKACKNLEEKIQYISNLENRFINKLKDFNIEYLIHIENRLPGLLSIAFPGVDGQSLLIALDLKGIAVSFGSACSSGTTKASKILLDANIKEEIAKSTLRISFGKIHTDDDIDYVAKQISEIINRIKI